ncbi:MAG: hypothetical protein FJ299_10560 [Planctomycetes bacterium]|nr:hypothetical protein [Planctomycetota bacterium]
MWLAALLLTAGQDAPAASREGGIQADAWSILDALPPGRERALRAAELLSDRERVPSAAQLESAWRIGTQEAEALRFDSAVAVQRALYERVPALWSVSNLALSLNRLEGAAAADGVLSQWLPQARGAERADVWSQRGQFWLGAGQAQRGRTYLARALALGSADAGVMLAREDLEAGQVSSARTGFASALLQPDPSPWALRGFGVALLTP